MSGQEGDSTELNFGPGFVGSRPLFLSEVKILLEKEDLHRDSDVYQRTLEYARKFSQFDDVASAIGVRKLLSAYDLHEFELAQIATLLPGKTEEAEALIPSITNKLSANQLNQLLSQCRDLSRSVEHQDFGYQ
ncbi:DNA-directed RNA polymerase II subunit RPB4-like [Schistocerca gregaria]|uniref:DNA-directed RNA polymerase II subunit RPB4-like n=1 Tax=Schistocerca gregaria TaxID=7010 RepID=UPI00211F2D0B|nr:DNA-directed RNA polymerase II subunit RPB4-like [Schistocerca gregaria]